MRTPIAAVLAALLLPPTLAAAQDGTPPRVADVWNGKDHVLPRPAEHAEEKQAGVALSPAQRRNETDEVESLARQLEQAVHAGPGAAGQVGQ